MAAKKHPTAHRAARAKHLVRSNRHWSKRLLMHPTSTFALLVVGVFLIGLSYRAAAHGFDVEAVVPAPALHAGATITSPADNKTFKSSTIIVSGQCPNEAYVKLTRNGVFSGAAICQEGAYGIETDLFSGQNELHVQAYNITDAPGPATPVIRAVYEPPAGSVDAAASALLIQTDYRFAVHNTSESYELSLSHRPGTTPYQTRIDWGDGQDTNLKVPASDALTSEHAYQDAGYYQIHVTTTDADERTVSMQLVALIKNPGDPAVEGSILGASTTSKPPGSNDQQFAWLKYAWPTYGVVTIMVLSFWLGERREYLKLVKGSPGFYKFRRV